MIISPSDHMDIFFQSDNITEAKNIIVDNINSFNENVLIYKVD